MKITETKSEVSSYSGCANPLTNSCVQNSPEIQLAIVSAKKHTSVKDRVMDTNSKAVRGSIPANALMHMQKSSEDFREIVPTAPKHIAANGKQALMLLQSAAAFIPVQEAIGVALKIIEVCEVREIPMKVAR
jgi:hypothetical protein